jgi:hypothetical protein
MGMPQVEQVIVSSLLFLLTGLGLKHMANLRSFSPGAYVRLSKAGPLPAFYRSDAKRVAQSPGEAILVPLLPYRQERPFRLAFFAIVTSSPLPECHAPVARMSQKAINAHESPSSW